MTRAAAAAAAVTLGNFSFLVKQQFATSLLLLFSLPASIRPVHL
jgi:hypothetical protein